MSYTMADYRRDFMKIHLKELSPEERLEGLSPEELLRALSAKQRAQLRKKLRAEDESGPTKPRRKR
jgi:hypothetical protein